MPDTAVEKKETTKSAKHAIEAPEGLSKDEEQAWRDSLPEPAEEIKTTTDVSKRVESLETRIANLERLLNVTLGD